VLRLIMGRALLLLYVLMAYTGITVSSTFAYYYGGAGAAISLQARSGPEGSRRLRLPDFLTVGT
jgi:hypothetical protein